MAPGKVKVLFLCTGNSARSQMAEAFLRKYGGDIFEVHSAGTEPKGINPYTIHVMDEVGVPVDRQISKDVRVYLGYVNFGYLIFVCDQAEKNCPTTFVGFSNRQHWSFEDPAAFDGNEIEKLEKFRQVRDQIEVRVKYFVAEEVHYLDNIRFGISAR